MSHRIRNLIIATALAVATVLGIAGTASAATAPASYFGIHYSGVSHGSWPQAHVGSIRLWDTGTAWSDIESVKGVRDWSRLDAAVANAERHGASVNYVFGLTPAWASSNLAAYSIYGPGLSAPPTDLADFWVFVHDLVSRYRGRIASYEVWNEVDCVCFYTGTVEQMVAMTHTAANAIHAGDPRALVVSPSTVPRFRSTWVRMFAAQGGFGPVDVVSIHGYPDRNATPESSMAMLEQTRAMLASYGVRKPIWNSETNYNANVAAAPRLAGSLQASYVARTYLLSWAHGFRQVGWYDWSATSNIGVHMAAWSGSRQASQAGRAFSMTRWWMRGNERGCTHSGRVYRCAYTYPHGRGVVTWTTSGTARVQLPAHTVYRQTLAGHRTSMKHRRTTTVGTSPVMLRASR